MRIIVIGKTGKLGSALIRYLEKDHHILSLGRFDMDLGKKKLIRDKILSLKPQIIINASAYTDVQKSEELKEYAFKINSSSLKVISSVSEEIDAKLIHFSTDYVFDGKKNTPYNELDKTNPLNYYGLSKLYGEQNILKSNCKYLIFRLTTLLGGYENNIIYKILENSISKKPFKMVQDQLFTPTSVDFVAKNISLILSSKKYPTFPSNQIYHLSPLGNISPYFLANNIFDKYNQLSTKEVLDKSNIEPILLSEYKSNVNRPKNCILDNSKFYKSLKQEPEKWEGQFNQFADKIISKFIYERNSYNYINI